ncbi:riboflavin biosynthesis protein RibF [Secundilactobacillus malefermentans]|uniref:Riboflavin biosynthesis protein n=1 Tax=Secundilactobacillus malefermentans TaxID=176292 RepID=A0A4R5NNJ1_9LACO|nr:riboflavin biosynthesis protein RibF [Secundilactobacillus malefermentans]KRM59390.1 FAD synthase [Secundilactobacillus malefermentans DSM 5705 = KCTC 3548]QEA32284.1 riboflavin biosynthesis protein RibF [Secundilactobacillus malefermentans]TDG78037.1 hypothetical protein C5L31_001272 [Secundilactobacillus malefermentans]
MKVINIHHPLNLNLIDEGPVVLAMGFFDGVHKGHQEVIKAAKKEADKLGVKLAVLTYDHHPEVVYRRLMPEDTKYITPQERRLALLEEFGVNLVYLVNFTGSFSALSPQQFVDQYICALHPTTVVAGFDHTYGAKDSDADMAHLAEYAQNRFKVITVGEREQTGDKVSSSRIRDALDEGDLAKVNLLLGYTFQTKGVVVHGFARGRTIGFPTININHPEDQWLPGIGIYTTRVKVGDKWVNGMASIGRNVTFGEGRPVTVEIYLLDFTGNLYGENVAIEWFTRLRGEVKFSGADALVTQLNADEEKTREFFKN